VSVPAVDGNVIRVVSRIYHIEGNPMENPTRAEVERLAAALVPEKRAGDHNQAMMDLGATVCVPGTPDCERCPVRKFCRAEKARDAADLPKIPGKKPPKEICYDVPLIFSGSRVLMRQRTEKMLQGLWCFPLMEGWAEEKTVKQEIRKKLKISVGDLRPAGEAKHVFTHQVWKMRIYLSEAEKGAETPKEYEWIPLEKIPELALPAAMRVPRETALKETCFPDGE